MAHFLGCAVAAFAADQPACASNLRISRVHGSFSRKRPRPQFRTISIHGGVLSNAFSQNRPDLLDQRFIGEAEDKLATRLSNSNQRIHTVYHDKSHDVKILFYSPDGLSIELADAVQYDVQLFDHDKAIGTERVHARYIVVLTPTEVRWRVRIFQAQPE